MTDVSGMVGLHQVAKALVYPAKVGLGSGSPTVSQVVAVSVVFISVHIHKI